MAFRSILGSIVLVMFSLVMYSAGSSEKVELVRGVELKMQPFFSPNRDFTCLDGKKSIPFSSVNDDYCDCPDGTDEPGTSACPGGRYYCYNIGYTAKYIPSSRVNDGICDCCDGSDEYDSSVVCFNECEKYGIAEQEMKKEEMAETLEGAKARNEYIQSGKERKEQKMERIETINGILEQRRKELEAATTVKESAEAPEKEAKDQHQKEWEEKVAKKKNEEESGERNAAFDVLDIDGDGWISIAELLSHKNMESDMTEEESKAILSGETMVDREGMANVWKAIKPKYRKDGRPDPSQFDESNSDEPPPEVPEKEKKDEEKPGEGDQMPDYDDSVKQLIEVAEKARAEFETVDKHVKELEKEKSDLEDYMKIDFGPHEEFSVLKGECYELNDREYTYKLCPFERVSQKNKDGGGSETSLGNKMVWVDKGEERYNIMKYENGQTCWNGPARSTIVHLSCGKENKLISVSEPSRCEYEMSFKTPSLCEVGEEHEHEEL